MVDLSKISGVHKLNDLPIRKLYTSNVGCIVDFRGSKAVLKSSDDYINLRKEHFILDKLSRYENKTKYLKSPKILWYGYVDNKFVSIIEYIEPDSKSLSSSDYSNLITNVLSELHGIPINIFDGVLEYKSFSSYISDAINMCNAMKLDEDFTGTVYKCINILEHTKQEVVPVHTDFVPHNFVLKNKQLVLFDYEDMIITDSNEDYARITNYFMVHNLDIYFGLIDIFHGDPLFDCMRIYKALYLSHYYYLKYNDCGSSFVKQQHKFWIKVVDRLCKGKEPYDKDEVNALLAMESKQVV